MSIDGEQAAQGRIEHTIANRYSLDETFDVGLDTGTPVVEDYVDRMPFEFSGVLEKVVVELGRSGLASAEAGAAGRTDGQIAAVRVDDVAPG